MAKKFHGRLPIRITHHSVLAGTQYMYLESVGLWKEGTKGKEMTKLRRRCRKLLREKEQRASIHHHTQYIVLSWALGAYHPYILVSPQYLGTYIGTA